jgi:NADH dehydrogenase FAD-containing subunit
VGTVGHRPQDHADAIHLRERMLLAFKEAERQRAETGMQNRLTFVIVGGGPTSRAWRFAPLK